MLFLGFDLSTQQLKIVACDENLNFHSKYSINFDDFNDKYKHLHKGVVSNRATGEVITPVRLFVDAFQSLLDKMKLDGFPFDQVHGVSGSCQQHGTVYYNDQFNTLLNSIDSESNNWSRHLSPAFSFPYASNWQDRSTSKELEDFESALGSVADLCSRTGSKAHYRFSGPQMRRRARGNTANWTETSHISLISSFLDSLLVGFRRGIEHSEACGTNLFDIVANDWDDELLSLILMSNSKVDGVSMAQQQQASTKAREMLGSIVEATDSQPIATYLVERYGFDSKCRVWPITGDNLATIMALPLRKDDLLVSMGTSTTVLLLTEKYLPSRNYHLFQHPVEEGLYMGMLCYSNGALAREQIRDDVNNLYGTSGWDKFNELLDQQYAECTDKVGVYFPIGEIIPNAKPCKRRFQYKDGRLVELDSVPIEEETVLIIESQALSNRLRVSPMLSDTSTTSLTDQALRDLESIVGATVLSVDNVEYPCAEFVKRPRRVYYVGGSSQNEHILKVYSDILGAKEGGFRVEMSDACALGGCYRAVWGGLQSTGGSTTEFTDWINRQFDMANLEQIAQPGPEVDAKWVGNAGKVGVLSLVEELLD